MLVTSIRLVQETRSIGHRAPKEVTGHPLTDEWQVLIDPSSEKRYFWNSSSGEVMLVLAIQGELYEAVTHQLYSSRG